MRLLRLLASALVITGVPALAQVPAKTITGALSTADLQSHKADSMARALVSAVRSRIDTLQYVVSSRIDSLQNLGENADEYLRMADSLSMLAEETINLVPAKLDEWKEQLGSKYMALEQKITGRFSGVQSGINQIMPEGVDLPGIPSLSAGLDGFLSEPLESLKGKLPELPGIDLPGVDNPLGQLKVRSFDLPQIDLPMNALPDFSAITSKVGSYGEEFSAIVKGDFSNLDDLSAALEERLAATEPIQDFSEQAGDVVEQWKEYERLASLGKDTAALKNFALEQVREYATDHFAGKELMLKTALDKVSQLKARFSDVKSLAELPKRPPNPMKGRKWTERLVPSLTLQFQKSGYFFTDFNPALGWRFNGWLTAGAGWNERVGINDDFEYSVNGRVYGPRVYTEVRLPRGFAVRADGEMMKTKIESASAGESGKGWVASVFAGIKKDYRLFKGVRGNFQMLYNLFDDRDNSPYPDRLVVRAGMEMELGKKRRKRLGD